MEIHLKAGSKMNNLISIIIPCYNCASIISETILSLENQTQKNFEVICVNDGSTDNTLDVLKKWKEYSVLNITVIDQVNSGVSVARNIGISVAKGDYLLFLDSDDIYNKHFIEKISFNAEQFDVSFCRLSRNLEEVINYDVSSVTYKIIFQKDAMSKLLYEMGSYGFCCYLYKKEIIDRINLRFDENTRHFEDREFNWKYLCHCQNVNWMDAPLYGYRVNDTSVTRRPATWQTDRLEAIKRVEAYLEEYSVPFVSEVKTYLFARGIWGLAKDYSKSHRKDLFCRLRKEYDLKTAMKRTAKDKNKLVKLASWLYLIHPKLFYWAISLTRK